MRLVVLIGFVFFVTCAEASEIRIASASNFYLTLSKIKKVFEIRSEHRVIIIRGSTGKLYAQIINGAPYDIFLSADSDRADKLAALGKADKDQAIVYAIGQLAVWNPKAVNRLQIRQQLLNNDVKKIAIANPKTAPYGKAAIETLKSMGIYETLKAKLVYGENISQTLQFVESGAADIGFVAHSHIKNRVDESQYWNIAGDQHQPIEQKMLMLKSTRNVNAARAFVDFMQTEEIKNLIRNDGYQL